MFLINLYSIYLNLLLDAPKSFQFGFQDPASPMAEGLIDLHNYIFIFLIIVCSFVLWMLYIIVSEFGAHRYNANLLTKGVTNNRWYEYIKTNHLTHGVLLEIMWTLIPTFILLFIAMPSFALLYAMDEVMDPELTLKVMGHQWYWSYEFSDFNDVLTEDFAFDSYMIPEEELELGSLRLLETDCRVILPANTHISVVMTAGDVLHCWAVPSLGVKMDAVPGSLNQSSIFMKSEGLFFGQCSELCGVNHGFMPMVINAVSLDKFLAWVISNNTK